MKMIKIKKDTIYNVSKVSKDKESSFLRTKSFCL